ncbi:MAG: DUF4395 domain-containing protein [Pseudorhodobacter sp.]|nr:DUF4395 domain-containing protein [Frankiaceae bacterium]
MSTTAISTIPDIDVRGPRTAAWITAAVLAVVLLLPTPAAAALLAAQAGVFALGSRGRSPYGWVFRTLVRPRLGPATELEDPRPPRFAQTVGLAFAVLGVVGFASGAALLGQVATAFALVAALLNASIGLCLGCEVYLLVTRSTTARRAA